MLGQAELTLFDDARPRLLGLAYRILGSRTDAEDAVQDTFLKWMDADRADIRNPGAWLTTTCTRRCLDLLRAAHRTRVNYVGPWLPEPIQQTDEDDLSQDLDMASSLKTAFLLMLERLSPKERAAYLLHEIFDTPYADIADALDMQEAACRKLVSRARTHVNVSKTRFATPVQRQDQLLAAFRAAVTAGTTDVLQALLSEDIRLAADGGGKVPAIRKPLYGKAAVGKLLAGLRRYWEEFEWEISTINGERGFVLREEGQVQATVSFAYDPDGKATDIFIMRNPEKLENLGAIAIR